MDAVVIELSKDKGVWRMNQPEIGFSDEPLVIGMERIVDAYLDRMNFKQERYSLTLSAVVMDDSHGALMRDKEDAGGYWYVSEIDKEKGWLGLAGLQTMFKKAPKTIYYRVRKDASRTSKSLA